LVAGGGIGGLACALACAQAGHDINLFERAAVFESVGAGIQLGPNVTRILQGWGLADALKLVVAFPELLHVRDARSGKPLGQMRLGQTAAQRYGAPYATVHRGDLHRLLLAAVESSGRATLHLNSPIQQFESVASAVQLHLQDGSITTGDALIGADGLWSITRTQLLNDGPPAATGHVAFRALIQQSSLPAALRSSVITVWLGPKLHVVQYPVRGGEWLNRVCLLEADVPARATEPNTWDQAANAQLLQQAMVGMSTALQDSLCAVDTWRMWRLFQRPPVASPHQMAQGRVALLGDAAHPMLPYLAQGAGMAIEDAAALAQSLNSPQPVEAQLQHYAQTRWQRNARVQRRATRNGQIFHAQGPVAWGRNFAMKLLGERLLDMPWLYDEGESAK
jgi:salicylate hydroxylase